jgi:hypothetical protein
MIAGISMLRIEMNDNDESSARVLRQRAEKALQRLDASSGSANGDDDRLGVFSARCRLHPILSFVPFVHGTPTVPGAPAYPENWNTRQQVPFIGSVRGHHRRS